MEILFFGSKGPITKLLQKTLNRIGYNAGEADGIFGEQTYEAVIQFQQNNQIPPTGIVWPQTWDALAPALLGYSKYTVQAGDTLFKIAEENDISVRALTAANPGVQPDSLEIGTVLTVPSDRSVIDWDIEYCYDIMYLNLRALKIRYPFIEIFSAGRSAMNQEIYGARLGRGDINVLYNASHHANEWITTPVLMKFLEDFAGNYLEGLGLYGRDARTLFDRVTLSLVPMVNPDGVDLVTGQLKPESSAYKTAQSMNYLELPFPSGWKANIRGVDLNVNYPAGWDIARAQKFEAGYIAPGPRDYVGPFPLSEPESMAMAELTMELRPRLTLSYHTQGQVIYWKYLNYQPENSYEIGRQMADASGYTLETTPEFSGYAGYKDWFIQNFNLPGYTIECGIGQSPLPLTQFEEIYSDNIGILTLGMELA